MPAPDPAIFRTPAVAALVALALAEDGVAADLTTRALVPDTARGIAHVLAKGAGRIAGLPLLDPAGSLLARFAGVAVRVLVPEASEVAAGTVVASLTGPAPALLALERTLLNFLQRMSGIATETARYVRAVAGTRARILDTRKTCPGHRVLDKYAVAAGGGENHRSALDTGVLIKENHLVFAGEVRSPAAVGRAVARARAAVGPRVAIEVEVETLDQLAAALETDAEMILLDNMDLATYALAVTMRNTRKSSALLEASGGVTLERVGAIAQTGVDRISIGALTHSVRSLDLSLDLVREPA